MKKGKKVVPTTENPQTEGGIFETIASAKKNLDDLKMELEISDQSEATIISILKNPENRKVSVVVSGNMLELAMLLASVMSRDEDLKRSITMALMIAD